MSNNARISPPVGALEPARQMPALDGAIHLWSCDTGAARPRDVRNAARTALGQLLRGYAGGTRAPAIEVGIHGKPFAPDLPWLDFNLSHAGRHVVLAFARHQPLGVDIEESGRRVSVDGIAARFFSLHEASCLARVEAGRRHGAFLQLWTHKEAVLKALGQGLGFGLDRVGFELAASGETGPLQHIAAEAGLPAEWQVHRFTPAVDVIGSVAWRGPPRRLHLFQWPR